MKFCHDHWHELKNAIRQRGMWGLVRSNVYAAPARQEAGQASEFDPMMTATLMISEQALMAFGTYLLSHHCCPLCEVEQNLGKGLSLEWIDIDADAVLELCRQRHLIDSQ
jgi:hypothetical protein